MHPTKPEKPNRIAHLTRLAVNGGLLASCLAFGSAAQANITFQFDFGTNTGVGFWDNALGASRQAALNTAASSFSNMFASHFSNSGTILLSVTGSDDQNSGTLASAGSLIAGSSMPGFTAAELIKTKLQGGADANGAAADGSVDVNFGHSWQLALNAPVSNGQFDFYSTMYHEFTHALGFASYIEQDGTPVFGTKSAGQWNRFDSFLVDANGNRVVNPNFSLNQGVWNAASVGGTSPGAGMFFDGAYAKAANGGAAVGLYSPTDWEDGSSISHLDTDNLALAGMMMLHSTTTGLGARDYSAIEVGIMRDLGYTVAAVPEPETYAMLLAGLGLIGGIARRRRV